MAASHSQLDLTGTGYCASLNFRRTARAVTALFDAALLETGIRSTQFAILIAIAKIQPAPIGRIADVLVLDRTTLTRSLRLLQKDGFLIISARANKRQRFLSLTSKGANALELALPVWRKIQARFADAVGPDHWIELRAELAELANLAVSLEEKKPRAHGLDSDS